MKLNMYLLIFLLLLYGCSDTKDNNEIVKRVAEQLKDKNSTSCKSSNNNNSECNQKSASNIILKELEQEDTKEKLERDLYNMLSDLDKEDKKTDSSKEALENLVDDVDAKKKIQKKDKDIETLVDNYYKKDKTNAINKLEKLVDNVGKSKSKREKIESKLKALVDDLNSDDKANIKKDLSEFIDNVYKETKSNKKSLEELVLSATNSNDKNTKEFVGSILKDITNKNISLIKTDKDYIVIKVQKGDSLSSLAQRYYKNAKKYNLIYNANRDKIGSDKIIYPNTTLKIPKISQQGE